MLNWAGNLWEENGWITNLFQFSTSFDEFGNWSIDRIEVHICRTLTSHHPIQNCCAYRLQKIIWNSLKKIKNLLPFLSTFPLKNFSWMHANFWFPIIQEWQFTMLICISRPWRSTMLVVFCVSRQFWHWPIITMAREAKKLTKIAKSLHYSIIFQKYLQI